MKYSPKIQTYILSIFILSLLQFSCAKDSEFYSEIKELDAIAEEIEKQAIIDATSENETLETNEDSPISINFNNTSKSSIEILEISEPSNGVVENKNGALTYYPNPDFYGEDNFYIKIKTVTQSNETKTHKINIKIVIKPIIDIVNDEFEILNGESKVLDLLKNDTFKNKDKISVSVSSAPKNGNIVINQDNTFTYTPKDNVPLNDIFKYTVSINNKGGNLSKEEGTVIIVGKSISTPEDAYFVSPDGNNSNDGRTEETAWKTLTYAASSSSPVEAGDKVYIKSGTYYNERINFRKTGTTENPIIFEGYKNIPGDIITSSFTYGDELDDSKMPLFLGSDPSLNDAFTTSNSEYIVLKNLQISNYLVGIQASNAKNQTFDNIIGIDFGAPSKTLYSGKGIKIGSGASNVTVKNSFILNAGAEGISIYGNENSITNTNVYCDNNTNPTDYYIIIKGNNNIVENSTVTRIGNLDHNGHGIQMKSDSKYNKITNCTAINTIIGVRWRGAQYNTITDCNVIGGEGKNGSLSVRDGASNNNFINCKVTKTTYGATFYDTVEDGNAQYTGDNNTFTDCVFTDVDKAISFFYYSLESPSYGTTFKNCEFNNANYLFQVDRENYNNSMTDCKVDNVKNLKTTRKGFGPFKLNFDFGNTVFTNVNFSVD